MQSISTIRGVCCCLWPVVGFRVSLQLPLVLLLLLLRSLQTCSSLLLLWGARALPRSFPTYRMQRTAILCIEQLRGQLVLPWLAILLCQVQHLGL